MRIIKVSSEDPFIPTSDGGNVIIREAFAVAMGFEFLSKRTWNDCGMDIFQTKALLIHRVINLNQRVREFFHSVVILG